MNEQKEKELKKEIEIKEDTVSVENQIDNSNDAIDDINTKIVKKKNKKLMISLIIGIILLIFLGIFSVIFAIFYMNNSEILPNITINGISMEGMSKEEAVSSLSELVESKKQKDIDLSYPTTPTEVDTSETETSTVTDMKLTFSSLEINYKINEVVNSAYKLGRSGNLLENNFSIIKLLLFGENINLDFDINNEVVDSLLSNISSNLSNKVIQCSYYIEGDNLIVTTGTEGNTVDTEEFNKILHDLLSDISSSENTIDVPIIVVQPDEIDLDKIHSEIYKEAQNAYYEKEPFKVYNEVKGVNFDLNAAKELLKEDKEEYTIPLIITTPEISVEDLNINVFPDLLGNFTTKYDASNTSRTTNLNLAAAKVNGTILSPGEEFSYNKIVGERTIAAGYKEAKIYSAGQVIDGLGGGICQISSTLYNAVIFANLEITERHNHQFVTSYVPAGRDATVVYGAKDFKFKNNRTYPIKILFSVSGGIAKASIYGIKEEVEYDVSFDIDVVSRINYSVQYEQNSSLPSGTEEIKQKGSTGVIVKDYKVLKLNGNVVSKTFLAQDRYNPMPRIIIQGTGYVAPSTPSKSTVTETPTTTVPETSSNTTNNTTNNTSTNTVVNNTNTVTTNTNTNTNININTTNVVN